MRSPRRSSGISRIGSAGTGSGGGSGFGSYPDLRTAASYVAQQLDRPLFSAIHDALAADSPVAVSAQAIMGSPWATSHYGNGSLWHAVDVPIVAAPAGSRPGFRRRAGRYGRH